MLLRTTIGDKSIQWLKGQLGLEGWETGLRRQPRGQIYFQGNTVSSTFTETYIPVLDPTSSPAPTPYSLDTSSAIQFAVADSRKLQYTGSASRWFNVIGTLDVENTTGSSLDSTVKLAKNDVVIDATQCNATIPHNGVGKLHTMWILPLEKDDYVELYVATATGVGSKSLTPKRSRLQATCLS